MATSETQKQEKNAVGTVQQVKSLLANESVRKRFQEVMGDKAPQFMASIVNVVYGSEQLQKSDPNSIMAAAFVAATLDLPIDSNLGFAAIVPYNKNKKDPKTGKWETKSEAQFQMMYKGFIQLAIRSCHYDKMNCAVVYKDELKSYNPITGELEFTEDFDSCTDRDEDNDGNIAGYYAWFKLKTGFSHELFMTKKAVENHAKKYSQSYRYDLDKGKKASRWSTDFNAMALKTVVKMLLSKWGILSVDIDKAIQDDQKVFDEKGNGCYEDNNEIIDVRPDEIVDPFAKNALSEEESAEIIQNKQESQNAPAAAQNVASDQTQEATLEPPQEAYDQIDIDSLGV